MLKSLEVDKLDKIIEILGQHKAEK